MNRRHLLTAASLSPILGGATLALPSEVDLVVVGAGAAGISAAITARESSRSVIVLEAQDHVGGRCVSVRGGVSRPVDRGAHWLHSAERNPLVPLLKAKGFSLYDEPRGERVLVNGRPAREGELEEFVSARASAQRSIAEPRKGKDLPLSQAFSDSSRWRPTLDFYFGPYDCGKDPDAISTLDFQQADEGQNMFCAEGYGTALASFAEGLPIALSTRVKTIDTSERLVRVDTDKGTVRARSVIVTLSTNCLASGAIQFKPALPKRYTDIFAKLSCGTYEHVIVEIPGNPAGARPDEAVLARTDDGRTFGMLARVGGSDIWYLDAAGSFARDLWKGGVKAVEATAREFIRAQLGLRAETAITAIESTSWQSDPFALGSWSVAEPGAAMERRTLSLPVNDRLFFAGEATEPAFWGTVHGAWISGRKAAEGALRTLGPASRPPVTQRRR